MEYAGLAKEVVVSGVGSRIEIWDREAWDANDAAFDIDALTESFGDAA